MKYRYFSLIVTMVLCEKALSRTAYDQQCAIINVSKTREWVCFDDNTLGMCIADKNGWKGIKMSSCNSELCCDATLKGCMFFCNYNGHTVSSGTIAPTTPTSAYCVNGELKKDPTDFTCKKYYYCSDRNWLSGICPYGVFDDSRKSCVVGTCGN